MLGLLKSSIHKIRIRINLPFDLATLVCAIWGTRRSKMRIRLIVNPPTGSEPLKPPNRFIWPTGILLQLFAHLSNTMLSPDDRFLIVFCPIVIILITCPSSLTIIWYAASLVLLMMEEDRILLKELMIGIKQTWHWKEKKGLFFVWALSNNYGFNWSKRMCSN